MNRMGAVCVCMLFGAGVVNAQQTAEKNETRQASTQFIVVPASRCPIAMRALQGASTQMVLASDGTFQHLMTPSLTLAPKDHRTISEGTVIARGYPASGGTLDLVAHRVDPEHPQPKREELEKSLTVKLFASATEPNSYSAELQLPGFNILNSIELQSVTFSDGSTWKFAADSCRVAPDPLLLIGAR